MNRINNSRRHFIRLGLALPLLNPLVSSRAQAHYAWNNVWLPDHIKAALLDVYGQAAMHVTASQQFTLKAPDIAENSAVVQVRAEGPKNTATSLAVLVDKNPEPLAWYCQLREDADVAVATRLKVARSSDIYLIAQTRAGLVASKAHVKITIGCGGG